ncbi:TIGR03747 family integrating conjugative element membrane protein, partial [Pseudomonas aeruginosa]
MAEVTQRAEQQQESQKTLVGTIISTPFQFLGVMFGSLIGAIIVEWVCLYFFWPDAGWKHAQAMFEHELSWLSQGLLHSVVVQEPGRTATWLAQLAYDWLFVKTGIVDWMTNMTTIAQAGPRSPLDVRYLTAQGVSTLQNYGLAALYTVLTFVVRLVILVMTIPLFLMAAFTGLVDGLVRRDLRKFGAGRESSYLYHKARGSIIPL